MTGPFPFHIAALPGSAGLGGVAWLGSDSVDAAASRPGWVQTSLDAIAAHAGLSAGIAAAVVLAFGLVALVAGGRMARPMLAATATSIGALLAALAPASLFALFGADESWRIFAMVACAVVFGAGGVALFRPAMAVSGAAAGSVTAAGLLALMTLLGTKMPLQIGASDGPMIHAASLVSQDDADAAQHAASLAGARAFMQDQMSEFTGDETSGVVGALTNAADAGWNSIPDQARLTIRVGLIAGAIVGLVFGALWPRRAAGAVASLLGAAGVVGASLALGVVAGVGAAWSASDVACGSLVGWLALAMLGALMQARRGTAGEGAPQAA